MYFHPGKIYSGPLLLADHCRSDLWKRGGAAYDYIIYHIRESNALYYIAVRIVFDNINVIIVVVVVVVVRNPDGLVIAMIVLYCYSLQPGEQYCRIIVSSSQTEQTHFAPNARRSSNFTYHTYTYTLTGFYANIVYFIKPGFCFILDGRRYDIIGCTRVSRVSYSINILLCVWTNNDMHTDLVTT